MQPIKAIYAFYTSPLGGKDIRSARTHWALPYIEFLTLAYSSKKSKEYFGKTCLVTDALGKKLIIDELGIEFDEVKVVLDGIEGDKPRFWASGKLWAYTHGVGDKFEPFVFFDNDAGFNKQPPAWLFDARYRCQHIHHDTHTIFETMVAELVAFTPNIFPYDIYHEAHNQIEGVRGGNAGLVVCNDEELWKEFTRYTWAMQQSDFFDKIVARTPDADPYRTLNLWNVVVEEILLFQLYRRLRHEQPQTLFEFNGLHVPVGTHNPTEYFHIWISKHDIDFLRRYEQKAIAYIDPKIKDNIYKYFNVN